MGKAMGRILSLVLLPILGLAVLVSLFPTTRAARKVETVVDHVTHVFTSNSTPAEPDYPKVGDGTSLEEFAAPSVTVGPEYARQPEIRIWAIRNDTNYGWIQLPRGTPVQFLRQDGDYLILRYQDTVIRAHRSVVEAGLIIPRKARTYAVAY
jgi:hypothetical protein